MSSNQIKVKQSKPNYQNLVLVGQYWSQVQNQCELKSNQRINSNDQANGLRGSTQKVRGSNNQFKRSKNQSKGSKESKVSISKNQKE